MSTKEPKLQPWSPSQPLTFGDQVNHENAIDLLVYGSMIKRATSGFWTKLNPRLFFLVPDNKEILQWVSDVKSPGKSRILLTKITRIFFGVKDTP